ncbi:hypothetical protein phiAS5_ORF0247 [Aeromonas phage phiAS5]|uniref:Uncharacterized protein n=1 Tax=Aeromonas phage phiAS5 TaxID=879630 RepID=E1A201_9CAUD|nr:hypothetical protein phiAS5_ORF0247 [Aeromonas phage phiAS5]ADM80090.1 hypothetical protein phiAS5_ORF0247 [Aeromonas phage phiAS5]BES53146.1 hypothetical protein [Aeromonas phage phiWae14]
MINDEMIAYMAASAVSKEQLRQIRELEELYSAERVGSKLSREGVKLLSRINAMYEHRMTQIVPEVVRAERAFTESAHRHYANSLIKGNEIL